MPSPCNVRVHIECEHPPMASHDARWRNWSGSCCFAPRQQLKPRNEAEVVQAITSARAAGQRVRAVGAGHSSSVIVGSEDVLVDLREVTGVVAVDGHRRRARVRAGTTLEALGSALYQHDLALPNYGDISGQTVAGALASATHGSGRGLRSLSDLLVGVRLVDGHGRVRIIDDRHPDLPSHRVSLGVLGVATELTLQLVPTFDVERREYSARTDDALADMPRLVAENYSFDMYWYPRRDDAKLRLVNPIGGGTVNLPYATLLDRSSGRSHQHIAIHSGLPHRFEECEYALPYDTGLACFAEVRRRILQCWRATVGWRVLVRTVAADDADLSPHHGRDSMTVSLHQNAALPWRDYFNDIEPIFRAHGGRPHWAKKHSLQAAQLRQLYPRWSRFQQIRRAMDPDGIFLNPPLQRLLGSGHD